MKHVCGAGDQEWNLLFIVLFLINNFSSLSELISVWFFLILWHNAFVSFDHFFPT